MARETNAGHRPPRWAVGVTRGLQTARCGQPLVVDVLSLVVSAITGGFASIGGASTIAAKTELGRSRELTRRTLRDRVAQLEVVLTRGAVDQRAPNEAETWGRFRFAADFISQAESLSRWQRKRVRASMAKLVGPVDVRLAQVLPNRADEDLHAWWLGRNAEQFTADQMQDRGLLGRVSTNPGNHAVYDSALDEVRRLGHIVGRR